MASSACAALRSNSSVSCFRSRVWSITAATWDASAPALRLRANFLAELVALRLQGFGLGDAGAPVLVQPAKVAQHACGIHASGAKFFFHQFQVGPHKIQIKHKPLLYRKPARSTSTHGLFDPPRIRPQKHAGSSRFSGPWGPKWTNQVPLGTHLYPEFAASARSAPMFAILVGVAMSKFKRSLCRLLVALLVIPWTHTGPGQRLRCASQADHHPGGRPVSRRLP